MQEIEQGKLVLLLEVLSVVEMDKESMEREAVADVTADGDVHKAFVPKKGLVSVVWKYFGFTSSDVNQTTVFCKLSS